MAMHRPPPRSIAGILQNLGPGLIVAGAIVGSGELVATTKTGAEAGFWLLWLILIGCVIKVFAQVEFGRVTVTEGKTALEALDSVPGPRRRVNWIVWYWLIMTVVGLAQLGGIVGGVGQALALAAPLTDEGRVFNEVQGRRIDAQVESAIMSRREDVPADEASRLTLVRDAAADEARAMDEPPDPFLWAALLAIPTAVLLVLGRYKLVQIVSLVLVAAFTAVTVLTVFLLQMQEDWAISGGDIADGMSVRLPPERGGLNPMHTALAAFGIIGVGAAELIMYPYWCLEKGYARDTGRDDGSDAWVERARGWLRVMRWDALLSMFVYTVGTIAFYLLGAAVLGRCGLNPEKGDLVRTLSEMYAPVFGEWAPALFLVGAFAVLYSTYFVASASYARVCADAVRVFGVGGRTEADREWWRKFFCAFFPLASCVIFVFVRSPGALILTAGVSQVLMLPMLAFAALWFRYKRSHPKLRPGRTWDVLLWLSSAGLFLAGTWAALTKIGLIG